VTDIKFVVVVSAAALPGPICADLIDDELGNIAVGA